MIKFHCWYCNRKYAVPEERIGQRMPCGGCRQNLCVPRRSGRSSRARTPLEWLLEFSLYGLGGGLLGLGLAVLILSRLRFLMFFESGLLTFTLLTGIGFVAGGLAGERGLEWVGGMIRRWEDQ
jgi:hypothetical protein